MYNNINGISKKHSLSSSEITDLVIKYQKSRNPKKQRYKELIFNNVSRFIAKIAARHSASRIDEEDLFQAGVIGFCEAIEKFKPKMGNMFITYLKFWVEKNMYITLYANNLIYTPRNRVNNANKQQKKELTGQKVKYDKFSKAFINTTNVINLDNGLNDHDYKNLLRSPIELEDDIENSLLINDINNLMTDYLNSKEREVLRLRYLNSEYGTLKAVGKTMNLSTESIRQIEKVAIKKLKKHI